MNLEEDQICLICSGHKDDNGLIVCSECNHEHLFIYGDVPGLGECECGTYKVWNRHTQEYEVHERANQ